MHLLHAEDIRPKFVFDSKAIDTSTMDADFYNSMDNFYKSLNGTSKKSVTMKVFLIDDASYTGTQLSQVIFNILKIDSGTRPFRPHCLPSILFSP